MAHALSITDGTTTISLSGTNFLLIQYVPNVPAFRNGKYDPVVDSVELLTDTASGSAATTAINGVEKLLDAARRRQGTKRGAKVYLQLTLDGGTAYRSEVIDGNVALGMNALRAWGQGKIECTMVVTRVPYWEGALTQLVTAQGLTNADGSNSYYTATAVTGVLPTPAHVELTNDSGAVQTTRNVWFGINSDNAPATWDGTLGTKSLSWTAPQDSATYLAQWSLSNADLAAAKGDYFRFVVAFTGNATADVYYVMDSIYASVTQLGYTDEVYTNSSVISIDVLDFGTMAVPVGGYSTAMSDVDIEIGVNTETEDGSDTLAFVQMFPADNVKKYALIYQVPAAGVLVDDNIEEKVHVLSSGVTFPNVYHDGSTLMLYPGRAHRFSWVASDATTGYDNTFTAELDVWYRPRVLTI